MLTGIAPLLGTTNMRANAHPESLLQYVTSIVYVVLQKIGGKSIDGHAVIGDLVSLRVLLEKLRSVEHKMKYRIDKLLREATLSTDAAEKGNAAAGDGYGRRPNFADRAGLLYIAVCMLTLLQNRIRTTIGRIQRHWPPGRMQTHRTPGSRSMAMGSGRAAAQCCTARHELHRHFSLSSSPGTKKAKRRET